jgi:3-oxoacyl-[acyl-carrier protein] reductase
MNILISGASSEIALKVVSKIQNYNFYGISRSNTGNSKKFKKFLQVKDYTDFEIKKVLEKIEKNSIESLIIFNGYHKASMLSNFNPNLFDKIMDINLKKPLMIANQVIKNKVYSKNFSIIFIGSVSSTVNDIGNAFYSLSKSALINSTKILAKELKNKKIRVNCINIGMVETEMSENLLKVLPKDLQSQVLSRQNNKFVDISDIVSTLISLIDNKAINGQNFNLDNGYSL